MKNNLMEKFDSIYQEMVDINAECREDSRNSGTTGFSSVETFLGLKGCPTLEIRRRDSKNNEEFVKKLTDDEIEAIEKWQN